jgi:uncharacterized membrane protein YgdD (TMEM256/DUF423 family)
MGHLFIALGGFFAALAVAAGAFGAHGLADRLSPEALARWDTAARYLMYSALGLVAAGTLERLWAQRLLYAGGWSLAVGAAVFSGTLFGLALGGPSFLGAITPLGGLLIIAGFLSLTWAAIDRHLETADDDERVEEAAVSRR